MSEIMVATSIAPGANLANQQQAICSWLAQGFEVVSVNTQEEIDVLAPYFANITFVTASRDARESFGKPYIYFDDLLSCLYEQGKPICGIINSDIHLVGSGLYTFVKQEAPESILFGARIDVDSIDDRQKGEWYRGFDYFFFDRTIIPHYPTEDFCIGLPWWDYWAVLIPLAKNFSVKKIISPVAYHVRHTPGNLDSGSWYPLGFTYAKYLASPFPLTKESMSRYQPLAYEVLETLAEKVSLPSHVPISVVVHTLNEEHNIRNCLECVKWADEIVIIDMYSDDRTVEIARQYTDKIFMYERCNYVEPARQFALEQTTFDWVLIVDADELVTPELRNRIRSLADTDACDAVWVPSANYLFGHLMRGGGRGADEDRHLRFLKKSFVRFIDKIHSAPLIHPNARVHCLSGENQALIHLNYIDIEHFIEKLNRYTTVEAESDYLAGKTFNLEEAWNSSMSQVQKIAFNREGLQKDGAYGFGLGVLMAMYHFTAALKLKVMEEYNNANPGDQIRDQYQRIADEIIKQY